MKIREKMIVHIDADGIDAMNLLDYLAQGGSDAAAIRRLARENLDYIHDRNDCADFRLAYFVRAVYMFADRLPKDVSSEIIYEMSQFPYDDCAGHGMCTWTENHRLYIDGSEYLAALKNVEFADGRSADEHKKNAAGKLAAGLAAIERFGLAEWGSNNYYSETIAALSNVVQFVDDAAIRDRAANVLDMVLFDVCSQTTYNGGYVYNPATARAYVDNKAGAAVGNYLEFQIRMIMGERFGCLKEKEQCFQMLLDAGPKVYEVPACCREMLEDVRRGFEPRPLEEDGPEDDDETDDRELPSTSIGHVKVVRQEGVRVIDSVQGLDIKDYKKNGLFTKNSDLAESVRYAMTAGAISDYRLICKNMEYLCDTGLVHNSMLGALSKLARPVLYRTGLLKAVKRLVPVIWDSSAQEQGEVVTYNFGKYSFSAATDYHVGRPLFQQNTLAINLSHDISLFVTCPYRQSDRTGSPDYWTGSAISPTILLYTDIAECIFDMNKAPKGLGYTHLFFPTGLFDEVDISRAGEGLLFGRTGGVNIFVETNPGGYFRPIEESIEKDKSFTAPGKVAEGIYTKEYDFINLDKGFNNYYFEADAELGFEEFRAKMLAERQGGKR